MKSICLNNMFPEQCYPICGTITLMHGQNTYTCSCVIKHVWELKHYDESEIAISIHDLMKEMSKKINGKTIYLRSDEHSAQFKYAIDAHISNIDEFNTIRITNAAGRFEEDLSFHLPIKQDDMVYFHPIINMCDGEPHYFDIYAWKDKEIMV